MEEVEVYHTRRLTIPSIEEILGIDLKVLDHGFVRVIDYMGGDESIVQAARVSYGRGTKKRSQDRGLIRYLMRHRHTTPFEMCELKLHVKLPIFVARQWIRHRTANVNEYSARYSILDSEFYVPDREYLEAAIQGATEPEVSVMAGENAQKPLSDSQTGRLKATAGQSIVNKQGRGETVSEDEAIESLKTIHDVSEL